MFPTTGRNQITEYIPGNRLEFVSGLVAQNGMPPGDPIQQQASPGDIRGVESGPAVEPSSPFAGGDRFSFRLIDAEKAENPAHLEGLGDEVGRLDKFRTAAQFGGQPERVDDGPDSR